MDPIRLEYKPPAKVRLSAWTEQPDGSWRCGNVLVRSDKPGRDGRWFIYLVGADGTLTRIHPKSRPYGYGHAGQAKIGAALMEFPVEADTVDPVPVPPEPHNWCI